MKFQVKDVMAIVLLVLLVALKFIGYNGLVDSSIALIVGYYFGARRTGRDTGQ